MSASTETSTRSTAEQARMIPTSSAVMSVVVRVAGIVHARLDLSHAGTPEVQLGVSLGTTLIYIRSAHTARAIADGWADAAVQARTLGPAVVGRRPVLVGPSTAAVMVRMAGNVAVTSQILPGRPASASRAAVPSVMEINMGPMTWVVCDQTAYTSMLRAWRRAARLLGDNLDDDEE